MVWVNDLAQLEGRLNNKLSWRGTGIRCAVKERGGGRLGNTSSTEVGYVEDAEGDRKGREGDGISSL